MLSKSQRQAFDRDGFLAVPGVFQVDELSWLGSEARALDLQLSSRPRPSPLRWSSDEAPSGTHIDVHKREEAFRRLASHPRLLALAQGVSLSPVRLYRTRLCPGARLGRGDPIWRRDFEIWRRSAGLRAPNAVTAAVVLDGHYSDASALHAVPGSHRRSNPAAPDAVEPVRLSATFGSVILLHCATSYALSQPGDTAARLLFLVTYDTAAAVDRIPELEPVERAMPLPQASDGSLWPVPLWISG